MALGYLSNLEQEQANAAMWRSIEQCHVDVMGRFDREHGQQLGAGMTNSFHQDIWMIY